MLIFLCAFVSNAHAHGIAHGIAHAHPHAPLDPVTDAAIVGAGVFVICAATIALGYMSIKLDRKKARS